MQSVALKLAGSMQSRCRIQSLARHCVIPDTSGASPMAHGRGVRATVKLRTASMVGLGGASLQPICHFPKPILIWQRIGSEFFHDALLFAISQRSMDTQLVCHRRVDQIARIIGAHLEKNAVIKFAQRAAVERALEARWRVDPTDDVDAQR